MTHPNQDINVIPNREEEAHPTPRKTGFVWRAIMVVMGIAALAGCFFLFLWPRFSPRPIPPFPREIYDQVIADAIEKARQEIIRNPTSANWGHLAMLLTAHQYDQESMECYQEAWRLDPGDSRWPFVLGIISVKRDPNTSLDLIRKAIEVNTWDKYQFSMVMALVELLIERNQFDEAEKYLQKVSEVREDSYDANRVNLARGWLALHKGDEKGAREYFSLLQTHPYARRKATAQLANLAHSANEIEEANRLEAELKLLKADPDWPDPLIYEITQMRLGKRARENKIKNLEDQKNYSEAAEMIIEDLKEERTLKRLVGAGMNLTRSKQYKESLRYLYEAVAMDPGSAQARHYLSVCLLLDATYKIINRGDPEEIEKEYLECIDQCRATCKIKGDHANAFLICGTALKMLGLYEEAIAELQQAMTIKPDSLPVLMAIAEVYKAKGDLEQSRKYLEIIAKTDPAVGRDQRMADLIDAIRTTTTPKAPAPK